MANNEPEYVTVGGFELYMGAVTERCMQVITAAAQHPYTHLMDVPVKKILQVMALVPDSLAARWLDAEYIEGGLWQRSQAHRRKTFPNPYNIDDLEWKVTRAPMMAKAMLLGTVPQGVVEKAEKALYAETAFTDEEPFIQHDAWRLLRRCAQAFSGKSDCIRSDSRKQESKARLLPGMRKYNPFDLLKRGESIVCAAWAHGPTALNKGDPARFEVGDFWRWVLARYWYLADVEETCGVRGFQLLFDGIAPLSWEPPNGFYFNVDV